MTDELKSKMKRLRALAPELNAASSEAERLVAAVEAELTKLGLGVSAEVEFRSIQDGETNHDEDEGEGEGDKLYSCSYLAYGRHAGKFRIFVVNTREKATLNQWGDVNGYIKLSRDEVPWSSCPREIKLEAVAVLPDLLGKIGDATEELTNKAKGAAEALRGMKVTADDEVPEDVAEIQKAVGNRRKS